MIWQGYEITEEVSVSPEFRALRTLVVPSGRLFMILLIHLLLGKASI